MVTHVHDYHNREDGLLHCRVCNGAEGTLPVHCPGVKMTKVQESAVMAGTLDFLNNHWWTLATSDKEQYLADRVAEHYESQQTGIVRATVAAVMEAAALQTLTISMDAQRTVWDRLELATDRNPESTHVTFRIDPR